MSCTTIRYEVDDGIATVTLNRPDRLNAYNMDMSRELVQAFDRSDADDSVRAVIVTGAGRAFCAGADLGGGTSTFDLADTPDSPIRPDGSVDYGRESARDGGGIVALRIFRSLKPVIAAINGPAVGIGVTMTLSMDVRLASENARFGFVFARRGIVPEACSAYFLPRIVGISRAIEWCASGRIFSAAQAKEGGLVRDVLPPDELLPAARALAREIADNTSAVSVALIRQMMWRGLGWNHPMEAHRIESRGLLARGRSADVREGVQSFLEKRPASFPDLVSRDLPDYFPWWQEPPYS
jgi:enoyl-CoA hydratase/carnithine racemase